MDSPFSEVNHLGNSLRALYTVIMVQFIRLRRFLGWGSGFIAAVAHGRTASQLLALREAARMVPNCAQPIILAYGTCASAKISRDSAGAWLYAQLRHKTCQRRLSRLPPYKIRSLHAVLGFVG